MTEASIYWSLHSQTETGSPSLSVLRILPRCEVLCLMRLLAASKIGFVER